MLMGEVVRRDAHWWCQGEDALSLGQEAESARKGAMTFT